MTVLLLVYYVAPKKKTPKKFTWINDHSWAISVRHPEGIKKQKRPCVMSHGCPFVCLIIALHPIGARLLGMIFGVETFWL